MAAASNELRITRDYDAPLTLVFDAWTSADHLVKWFGPDGFTTEAHIDFRVGGKTQIRLVGHGFDNTVRGEYREIVRNARIVQLMRFDDIPDVDMVQTITFDDVGGKTRVTVCQTLPPLETLDAKYQELLRPRLAGAPIGWGQTLDHLGKYLAR